MQAMVSAQKSTKARSACAAPAETLKATIGARKRKV